jgi:hypothetical protein
MSLRRHRLITEHYNMMCLLLETRQEALESRFIPRLKQKLKAGMAFNDLRYLRRDVAGEDIISQHEKEPSEETAGLIARIVLEIIWESDPDPKKSHVQWMLNKYCSKNQNQQFLLEDLPSITRALELYIEVKTAKGHMDRLTPEQKDINRFKTIDEFLNLMRGFRVTDVGLESDKDRDRALKESTVLLDNNRYFVVIPNTAFASIFWGRGTEWCTAYDGNRNNMFAEYNSDGPLVIIRDKGTGSMWQFHRESRSFMDEMDRGIDVAKFTQDHPVVVDILDRAVGAGDFEQIDEITFDGWHKTYPVLWNAEHGVLLVGDRNSSYFSTDDPLQLVISTNSDREIIRVSAINGQFRVSELQPKIAEIMKKLGIHGNHPDFTREVGLVCLDDGTFADPTKLPQSDRRGDFFVYKATGVHGGTWWVCDDNYEGTSFTGMPERAFGIVTILPHGFSLDYRYGDKVERKQYLAEQLMTLPEDITFLWRNSNDLVPLTSKTKQRPHWLGVQQLHQAGLQDESRKAMTSMMTEYYGTEINPETARPFEWIPQGFVAWETTRINSALSAVMDTESVLHVIGGWKGRTDQEYDLDTVVAGIERHYPKAARRIIRQARAASIDEGLSEQIETMTDVRNSDSTFADDIIGALSEAAEEAYDNAFKDARAQMVDEIITECEYLYTKVNEKYLKAVSGDDENFVLVLPDHIVVETMFSNTEFDAVDMYDFDELPHEEKSVAPYDLSDAVQIDPELAAKIFARNYKARFN